MGACRQPRLRNQQRASVWLAIGMACVPHLPRPGLAVRDNGKSRLEGGPPARLVLSWC